jgi:organic hydroperoxide reductase OsmC/OhrA/uncharacterized metal-binding protein
MPNLPRKKVGLIACSGEEMPEGTVTRLAVRRVLEMLRPDDTVTLCLPLFLAGEERERAFARAYPTITIDGCPKRCAALATEKYSAPPTASFVVGETQARTGSENIGSARRLNKRGKRLAEDVAERIAAETDRLLKKNSVSAPARTEIYETSVTWTGGHGGRLRLGNGPEMDFSAPPDSHGVAGVLTPEDAFVGAVNTCLMLMFIWAAERFRLDLVSYECRAEGTKLIELDRTETFAQIVLKPRINIRAGYEKPSIVEQRAHRALAAAQKYSLVVNSIRSKVIVVPEIIVQG